MSKRRNPKWFSSVAIGLILFLCVSCQAGEGSDSESSRIAEPPGQSSQSVSSDQSSSAVTSSSASSEESEIPEPYVVSRIDLSQKTPRELCDLYIKAIREHDLDLYNGLHTKLYHSTREDFIERKISNIKIELTKKAVHDEIEAYDITYHQEIEGLDDNEYDQEFFVKLWFHKENGRWVIYGKGI